jgi:hypothetical protein
MEEKDDNRPIVKRFRGDDSLTREQRLKNLWVKSSTVQLQKTFTTIQK